MGYFYLPDGTRVYDYGYDRNYLVLKYGPDKVKDAELKLLKIPQRLWTCPKEKMVVKLINNKIKVRFQ